MNNILKYSQIYARRFPAKQLALAIDWLRSWIKAADSLMVPKFFFFTRFLNQVYCTFHALKSPAISSPMIYELHKKLHF